MPKLKAHAKALPSRNKTKTHKLPRAKKPGQKNLIILVISLVFAYLLSQYRPFHDYLIGLGEWGYIGAFIAGILYVSIFTFATGVLILLYLSESLNIWEICLLAGLGGVLGDFIIFKFIRDDLLSEVTPIYNRFGGKLLTRALTIRHIKWFVPVLGAILVASPLPDEIGVSLLGISKINPLKFTLIVFFLDVLGVFLIISASSVVLR